MIPFGQVKDTTTNFSENKNMAILSLSLSLSQFPAYWASYTHIVFVEGDSMASFSIATAPGVEEGATPFLGLLHFIIDPHL